MSAKWRCPMGSCFCVVLVWLPALCRLRQEGFDPALFPPLLFSNLLIYKTNTLSACQGAMARFARP